LRIRSLVRTMSAENDTASTKEEEKEDPPVIKTKLNFKRTAAQASASSKRRKKDRKPGHKMNGTASSTNTRKPDFDFTMEDDEAPLPKISKVFWPDKYTFKDALFSALSDADDARHWAQVFGSEIHIYPRPTPAMSDDEYASWVRERVYSQVLMDSHRRKEAETRNERMKRAAREKAAREEAERKIYEARRRQEQEWRQMFESRMNGADNKPAGAKKKDENSTGVPRNLRSQAPMQRWKDYLAALQPPPTDANLELLLLWQQNDVPWPTPSGLETDISEANVRTFINTYTVKYSETAGGDWKKAVRQNLYFWHPDKFQQIQAKKLEKLSEEKKEAIMKRVTEVSQILNKLAKE